MIVAALSYQLSTAQGKVRKGVQAALASGIGGYLAFIYLRFNLPGTSWIFETGGRLGVGVWILIGTGIGWFVSRLVRERPTSIDN